MLGLGLLQRLWGVGESLISDPGAQQMFHLPGSALFLSIMWLWMLPTTPHHTYLWKISMFSSCRRIWGCPHRGTLCLGVSLCPYCLESPGSVSHKATSLHGRWVRETWAQIPSKCDLKPVRNGNEGEDC